MRAVILAALAFVFAIGIMSPPAANAGEPTTVIQTAVDDILDILRSGGSTISATDKERIGGIVEGIFDTKLFSRRTLGREWKALNPAQQEEFVTLYTQLLKDTYIERVKSYSDEKVLINGEADLGKNKAEVLTTVVGSGISVPVVYRLYDSGGGWKVYDVLVEGVSLVKNYRSQFTQILQKGSPDELLSKLRKKVS